MAPVSFNPALSLPHEFQPKSVALAYSGGDAATAMISRLRRRYACDVIAIIADVGQAADFAAVAARAFAAGAARCQVVDLRPALLTDVVFPTLRAGALHHRKYALGGALTRPIIARHQIWVAQRDGCDALAHGGAGDDLERFELTYQALAPMLRVIAPCDLAPGAVGPVAFTAPAPGDGDDGNLWHCPPGSNQSPVAPLDVPTELAVTFERGTPVALDGRRLDPVRLMLELNELGTAHSLGRGDRGSRRLAAAATATGGRDIAGGGAGSPGGTILVTAHRALEKSTLDKATIRLKDLLAQIYADVVYTGQWFSPLREALDAFVAKTQEPVTGEIRLRLYNGKCGAVGRRTPNGPNDAHLATRIRADVYDQAETSGFIRLLGFEQHAAARRERRPRDQRLELVK